MNQKPEMENNTKGRKMKDAIAQETFNLDKTDNGFESEQSKPTGVCSISGNRYGILEE